MQYAKLKQRFGALPLQAKLTLINTFVVLGIGIAALLGVREGLRFMLEKELEVALMDEAYEIALNSHRAYDHPESLYIEMANTSAGHLRHGWFLQLYDESGRTRLWSSDNTPQDLSGTPVNTSIERKITRREDYYMTRVKLEKNGLPTYWLRLGASTDFISEDVENITKIILPIIGFLILLAPIGGYVLASRATAPLKKIIDTTEQLKPNQLTDRLAIRGTGDELDQLSEKINHFLDRIADHLLLHREFVTNAAHELRSPLAAIESSIDVTLSKDRNSDEYQDQLATVLEECRQLSSLVNQLLLLAESDAGCLEVLQNEVDFDTVVRSSLEMFAGVAEDKGVEIHAAIENSVSIVGESARVRHVVNNLIDNALKFTPPEGKISISLKKKIESHQAVLTISDTGIGIPNDCLHRLFDRFYQVDDARTHNEEIRGSGLGLSICKSFVEAFGGKISVQSQVGQGTSFEVCFRLVNETPVR